MPSNRSRRFHESLKQKKRRIASQQIEKSMSIALRESSESMQLAESCARLAWNLSTRFNIRLGHHRLFFCHSCKSFIAPLTGSRFRLSGKNRRVITITCLKCRSVHRKPF